jgi:hypothetical protein
MGYNLMSNYSIFDGSEETFIGEIIAVSSGMSPPDNNWLLCDGGIVSQSTYPILYSKLGTYKDFPDGQVWVTRSSGILTDINALTYGNGLYVYGSTGGVLLSSTNAINWTFRTSGTTSAIGVLAYGKGLYVYGDSWTRIASSTNVTNWTIQSSGIATKKVIAYGKGIFIHCGDNSDIAFSTNTVNWVTPTNKPAPSAGIQASYNALTYGNGVFVIGITSNNYNSYGTIWSSTNASDWTLRTAAGSSTNIASLTFGNGIYVYGGTDGVIGSSTNASNWTLRTSGTVLSIHAMEYGNGIYTYLAGDSTRLSYSTNAINWSTGIGSSLLRINALKYGMEYLCVGNSGSMRFSDNYSYDKSTEFLLPYIYSTADFYIKSK